MGGILSANDKFPQQNTSEFSPKKKIKRILSLEDIHGCQRSDNPCTRRKDQRQRNNKQLSLRNQNGTGCGLSQKSQSLDTIFEELSKDEVNYLRREVKDIKLELQKPLIPRIKLAKNRVKTKRENYSTIMSVKPDLPKAWDKFSTEKEETVTDNNDGTQNQSTIVNGLEIDIKKSDDNYFTKNFDECMKRLQVLEKEHELMENDGERVQLFYLRNESGNPDTGSESEKVSNVNRHCGEHFETDDRLEGTTKPGNLSERETCDGKDVENQKRIDPSDNEEAIEFSGELNKKDEKTFDENKELISEWYSNLKQHFEKNDGKLQKAKEMSCRVMGATLKNSTENVRVEDKENDTRHYFSKLVKSNRSLIDEELPDPDLVKNIRAKFQENLNSTLKIRLNNKLGGSLQNISSGKVQSQPVWRPLSAQCNRDDVMREIQKNSLSNGSDKTYSKDSIKDSDKEHPNSVSRMRLAKKFERDLKTAKDFRGGRLFPSKWTDSGSVSSGVSSDLSSYDTDLESYSKDGPEPEPEDPITISDDDFLDEVKDKHYIQTEILEKIRSFGTSVTYYGGEMITCSVGPLLSPTTQAIMEEITEKYREEKNISRTFEEFYRKYVETSQTNKMTKIGRAKSFGHSDVFNRPNTLNNSQIEMYKYDLEMEIGIRKPKGLAQTTYLKCSPTKPSSSENCEGENKEKPDRERDSSESGVTNNVQDNEIDYQIGTVTEEGNTSKFEWNEEISDDEKNKSHILIETKQPNALPGESLNNSREDLEDPQRQQQSTEISKPKLTYARSQSTPHEIINRTAAQSDLEIKAFEPPSQEILFGYDKKIFNDTKVSDIQFEEYEVCESALDKIQKLREKQITRSDEHSASQEEIKTFSVVAEINFAEENNNVANKENLENTMNKSTPPNHTRYGGNEDDKQENKIISQTNAMKPKKKGNHLRWPIETRGAIDIQRSSSQSPTGIVVFPNGKPNTKSKIRFF